MNTHIQNFSFPSQGPGGVGVDELKRRLLISDPDLFGVTVPCKTDVQKRRRLPRTQWFLIFSQPPRCSLSDTTRERSRLETEGVDYHFVSVHMFEEDILNHRYINSCRSRGFLSHGVTKQSSTHCRRHFHGSDVPPRQLRSNKHLMLSYCWSLLVFDL